MHMYVHNVSNCKRSEPTSRSNGAPCLYIYVYTCTCIGYTLGSHAPVYTGNIREVFSDNARGRSPRALSVNHRGYFPVYTAT